MIVAFDEMQQSLFQEGNTMNFKDRDINEQVEIAEKQINAFRDHLMNYIEENQITRPSCGR